MTTATPQSPADSGLHWRAPWQLFLVIALTCAALFAGTMALPHDPYIRFQQLAKTIQFRSQWVYERIALDDAPIDVAIVGNSRLGAGISGPQLQAELSRQLGRPVRVANLSMPQEGRNVHYVIVKRLLADHPEVKLIVLSAIEQMPRKGHPAFRDLADASDVVRAPMLINVDYANDAAVLPYRQIALFVQTLAPGAFGVTQTLDRAAYPGTGFDSTATFTLPDGKLVDRDSIVPEAHLAQTARARVAQVRGPVLPASMADIEFAQERHYTRAIAAMARARGVRLAFVQIPIYLDHSPVADSAFYRPFGPVLRTEGIESDYRLYSDYGHMNRHGTRKATQWLANSLAATDRDGTLPVSAPGDQ